MASRGASAGLALLATLLLATSARAEPSAADRETARTLMDQGRDLREKGELKEALKRFKAADDIMHVPTTALPVAKLQASLGWLVEARDTLASSLRMTPEKATDPQPFKDARAEGEQLDASLAGRVPGLTVSVTGGGESERVSVTVDGAEVPAAALGLSRPADPGHHVVVARTAHAEARQELELREGEQRRIELTLVPSSAAGEAPAGTPEAPPARATSHAPTLVTWAGVGLAGVGVLGGTVTGVLAMAKTPGLTSECTNHVCGPSAHSELASANALATLSDVGFAVALAGAAVAIVSLVVGHDGPAEPGAEPPRAPEPTAQVWLGLRGVGVHGTF